MTASCPDLNGQCIDLPDLPDLPDLSELAVPARRAELTPVALEAVRRLAARWDLSAVQAADLLGGIPPSTVIGWQAAPPRALSLDQLTRVSLLLAISAALQEVHPGKLADSWITRVNTNRMFAGETPLHVMLTGGIPAMVAVRALLDGRQNSL